MTTREFIESIVVGKRTNPGHCSSVVFDGHHIYSYGTHYPLLIKVRNGYILNDSGYSSTTAKHISWARDFATGRLALPRGANIDYPNELLDIALTQRQQVKEERLKLRKGAFRKAETLLRREYQLSDTISFLKTI